MLQSPYTEAIRRYAFASLLVGPLTQCRGLLAVRKCRPPAALLASCRSAPDFISFVAWPPRLAAWLIAGGFLIAVRPLPGAAGRNGVPGCRQGCSLTRSVADVTLGPP